MKKMKKNGFVLQIVTFTFLKVWLLFIVFKQDSIHLEKMKSLTKLKCLFAAVLHVHHLPLQEHWHWDPADNMPSSPRPHISHLILSLLCHTHHPRLLWRCLRRALKTPAIWQWECRAQLIPGESAAMQRRCFSRSPLIRVSATGSWCGEESRNWIKSGPPLFSLARHFHTGLRGTGLR